MTKVVKIASLLGTINSFLLIEDKIIIVDSGYGKHFKKIVNYFKDNKINKSLVSLIILTHAHLDHYDHVGELQKYFQAPILVSKKAKKSFVNGINESTYPKNILAMILKYIFYKTKLNKINPNITINGKLNISRYGIKGIVLSTPGHTEGSLSIIINDNECLSGDLLMNFANFKKSVWFINSEKQYLQSITMLRKLKIKKVFPSHGNSFILS